MVMKEKLESIIKRIIFKKYSSLYDVNIEEVKNNSFFCYFKSDECLEPKKQMEIDTEVKMLFSILSVPTKSFHKPSIRCFIDCGEGYEFKYTQGYFH